MSTSNTRFVINLNPSNTRSPVWLRSIRDGWSADGPVVVATNDRGEAEHFFDFYTARDVSYAAIGWPDSRVEEIEITSPSTPAEIESECVAQEAAEDIALVSSRMVSARSLNTLSALALAQNRITVRDACTEAYAQSDPTLQEALRAVKKVCKELGFRANLLALCDVQVTLADGSTLDLNWDSGIDGYDYAESTADAELLQAAEDAIAAPVAPSPVEILRCAIVRAACELATWSADGSPYRSSATTLECRAEFFRINGMIDCLCLLGGEDATVGFRVPVKKAYESAIPNCINIDALRVCTPR